MPKHRKASSSLPYNANHPLKTKGLNTPKTSIKIPHMNPILKTKISIRSHSTKVYISTDRPQLSNRPSSNIMSTKYSHIVESFDQSSYNHVYKFLYGTKTDHDHDTIDSKSKIATNFPTISTHNTSLYCSINKNEQRSKSSSYSVFNKSAQNAKAICKIYGDTNNKRVKSKISTDRERSILIRQQNADAISSGSYAKQEFEGISNENLESLRKFLTPSTQMKPNSRKSQKSNNGLSPSYYKEASNFEPIIEIEDISNTEVNKKALKNYQYAKKKIPKEISDEPSTESTYKQSARTIKARSNPRSKSVLEHKSIHPVNNRQNTHIPTQQTTRPKSTNYFRKKVPFSSDYNASPTVAQHTQERFRIRSKVSYPSGSSSSKKGSAQQSASPKVTLSMAKLTDQLKNLTNAISFDKKGCQIKYSYIAHSSTVTCLCTTLEGQLWSGSLDNSICLWNTIPTHSDEIPKKLESNHKGGITSFEYLSQYSLVASGGKDGKIKLWSTMQADLVNTLSYHKAAVNCMISQEYSRLISGSDDHSIYVYDMTSPIKLATVKNIPTKMCLVSPTNFLIGTNKGDVITCDYRGVIQNIFAMPSELKGITFADTVATFVGAQGEVSMIDLRMPGRALMNEFLDLEVHCCLKRKANLYIGCSTGLKV